MMFDEVDLSRQDTGPDSIMLVYLVFRFSIYWSLDGSMCLPDVHPCSCNVVFCFLVGNLVLGVCTSNYILFKERMSASTDIHHRGMMNIPISGKSTTKNGEYLQV